MGNRLFLARMFWRKKSSCDGSTETFNTGRDSRRMWPRMLQSHHRCILLKLDPSDSTPLLTKRPWICLNGFYVGHFYRLHYRRHNTNDLRALYLISTSCSSSYFLPLWGGAVQHISAQFAIKSRLFVDSHWLKPLTANEPFHHCLPTFSPKHPQQ